MPGKAIHDEEHVKQGKSHMKKQRILFLCTGNSCRSQMAEGWVRALKNESFEAYSAGVVRRGMDPRAVKAMQEAGVDISTQQSKTIDSLPNVPFDWVVTLCGHAAETCPFFPSSAKRIHQGFDDPPYLAQSSAGEEEAMAHYRRVRDEIRLFVAGFPKTLER